MQEILIVIAIILLIVCIMLGYILVKTITKFRKYKEEELERIKGIREEAIRGSRSVLGGKFTEHIAPYLPDFKYDPTEARFIGSPIDFVVFPGLATGEPTKVVFIEVKAGKSQLTSKERRVRDLILDKEVEWELIRHQPQTEP